MSLLGYDMTRHILSFIPPCYNKKNLSLVCKEWNDIISLNCKKTCRIYKTNTKSCIPSLSICLLHHPVVETFEELRFIDNIRHSLLLKSSSIIHSRYVKDALINLKYNKKLLAILDYYNLVFTGKYCCNDINNSFPGIEIIRKKNNKGQILMSKIYPKL